jgi:hypothetical protein
METFQPPRGQRPISSADNHCVRISQEKSVNDFPASININTKHVITYRGAKKFTPKGPTPISQIENSGACDQGLV